MKSTLLSLFAIALLSGSTNACVSGHQQCLNQTDFRKCAHGNWQVPQLILPRYVQKEDTVYPGQLESPGSDGQPGNNGNNGQPGRNDPPSESTPQTCSALELVNACLDRSSHIVETSCKPVENTDQARYYQCLCHNAREVAVCYNNCPNMVAKIAAQEGQVSTYAEKLLPTTKWQTLLLVSLMAPLTMPSNQVVVLMSKLPVVRG